MLKSAYLNEKPEKEILKSRLKEQEDLLFVNQNKIKDNKLPVVVLVEGWGTAGKGTLIGNVINNIDPRFYKVATFDMPTDLEKRKPFLCRYFEALPEAGKFRFYNTGWMNEIVMSRLDGSMSNSLYEKRIASIRRFERQLTDNGYLVLKFFMHITEDEQKKRIVASRKQVIEEENAAKKAAAWEKLEEGAVVKGIVRRFADFGAFVDLGGVDGLIHITDLAWNRVNHPSDVLSINQEVEVKILSLDRERERIQLGYKQLQPKPWDNIEEKYPVGTILERNVVRIRPFGAFIELEPGVDGLVHISQCALTRIAKVEDVLEVGQPVRVKVLAVDPEAKRISLSIREALADEAMTNDDAMEIPGEDAPVEEAPAAEEAPAEE